MDSEPVVELTYPFAGYYRTRYGLIRVGSPQRHPVSDLGYVRLSNDLTDADIAFSDKRHRRSHMRLVQGE
ncbi:MAG TPA: hypothetical protein VGO47_13915 [Chlamydiales bacterium]|nr:hypothetical protein [Chlamydiales bacterium]